MPTGSPYRPSYGANDWTARLPPGSPGADQGMVAQPYADPGYSMPNAFVGNLNQSLGQTVGGYLPVNALQPANPNTPGNPLAQGPSSIDPHQFFAETESELSPLERWLAQQRAKNNAQGFEPLPGITSGAAPKPWGLNRDQPTYNQLPAYGPGGRGVRHYTDELARIRPMDTTTDPGMIIGDDKMPGTRSGTPVIMQQRPQWKYRET